MQNNPSSQSVWITGAGGLIGHYLSQTAQNFALQFRAVPLTRERLDLTDFDSVQNAFEAERPEIVIHCAAMSKSPACQENPKLAYKLNVEVTARLAILATDIPFIFFSTDLVFDGRRGDYSELDAVNPLSVYAETKVAAESIVLANPKHTVIRTSLNGGASPTGDRGFNEEFRRAWSEGKTLRLFTDEFRCPIAAAMTARATWELVQRNEPGLYHVAGRERLSRWEIGQLLADRVLRSASLADAHVKPRIEPSSLKEYKGAPRAPDSSLNCTKVQSLLSFPLPGLGDWLRSNPNEPF